MAATGYKPVSQLNTAEDLSAKLDLLKRGRQTLENQWKLNLAFYKGQQYSYFSRSTGQIQTLPVADGDKPRYRVRLVNNQIITGAHSLLAKYTKTKPVISATPGSSSASDFKAAQMAERLLEFWWDDFSLDDKLGEALLWSIIAGQGYWKIEWDPHAGKPMSFLLDPQGKPITDDAQAEAFRGAMEKYGITPKEKVVYMGDIKVVPISPFNVFADPNASTWEDCKFAICVHSMEPDEIKARWGVDVPADSVSQEPDATLPFETGDSMEKSVKQVNIGYFLPTPSMPKGRYVGWVSKPDHILFDGPWPYPNHKLPIVKFPGLRTPGAIYDGSHVEQAIPLQKELNRTLSQLVEYKNLTIRPRVWAPTGSLRQRMTTEPGVVMEFNPVANMRPEVEQLPAIPPYVFEHLKEIASRLKEIFALTEVSEGSVPPNVEAGIAIDLLQELSADRLAPTIKLIEKSLARAGNVMVGLAKQYYVEPRLLKIKGSGGSVQVKKFTQADISGGVDITVETGSGLPRTRAGRQAQIERWVESGFIPQGQAYKHLDIADLKGLAAKFSAQEDQANRELEKLIRGEVLNEEAQADVAMQLQQGINPQTGDPLQSQEEAQAIFDEAGLQPRVGEDYDVHLDILGTFMSSVEFEGLEIDVRQRMIKHFNATLQAKQAVPPQPEPGKVNTNLQIKATLGPTAASKVLQKQGVQVSAEEMAEPPLETWVSDSVDKPDMDAAGPGQEANQLSQAASIAVESQAKLADAAVAAQIRQAAELRDQDKHDDDRIANAELGAAKAREANAKADLAERKAKETSFKPKPAAKAK
jgi:hypothetical protein